jgi:hypothetical protein
LDVTATLAATEVAMERAVVNGPEGGRPLGLPTWSDKLVAQVVRLLLEAYYEPQFLRPFPWFPPRPGLPHRAERGGGRLEGDPLVR